jgi:membrane protease YdiL (CAAX protease family)
LLLLAENPDRRKREAATRLVLMGTLAECGLGFVAFGGGWLFGVPIREQFHWGLWEIGNGLLAVLPMLIILCLVELTPGKVFQRLRALVDFLIGPLLSSARIPELALLSFAAGLGEEVFFRGFIQTGLLQLLPNDGLVTGTLWESPAVAIVVAAILFGAAHPLSPLYIILTAVMGAYLGLLFHWTGNLLIPIVAHGVYDFIALFYLARFRRRRSAPD